MKIQTNGDQMQIKTGGITQLVGGIISVIAGGGLAALPFTGLTGDNGEKMPAWVALIGLAVAGVGLFLVLAARNRTITLVKNGQSNITVKKLIGGGVESQDFQTSDIVGISLITRNEYVSSASDNTSSMERRSYLRLLLKDNSTIDVNSSAGSGGFNFNGMNVGSLILKAPLSKEAEQISGFLGVPLQAEGNRSAAPVSPPINPEAPASAQPDPPDAESGSQQQPPAQ